MCFLDPRKAKGIWGGLGLTVTFRDSSRSQLLLSSSTLIPRLKSTSACYVRKNKYNCSITINLLSYFELRKKNGHKAWCINISPVRWCGYHAYNPNSCLLLPGTSRMTLFCACVRWNLHLTFWSFSKKGKTKHGPSYFLWQPRMLSLFALRLTFLDVEKNFKKIPLKVHLLRVSPLLLIPEIHEMATWIHKQLSNKTDHKVKTENWITKNDFLSQIRRVIQIA